MTSPDFSPLAGRYVKARPAYPSELFEYLAGLVERRELAWDCATGSGQAAVGLAAHFARVVATDISAEQIRHAMANPSVEYRVASADSSGLDSNSVDLVTVAAAAHWLDLDTFYAEAERVLRPGGVLAVWTYHVGYVEPPFDHVFHRFYYDLLKPFFGPQVKVADDHYRTLVLPGVNLDPTETFFLTADWNLDQMKAFVRSWSGTQKYIEERGHDPLETIAGELESIWGSPDQIHQVRWRLYVRVARVG